VLCNIFWNVSEKMKERLGEQGLRDRRQGGGSPSLPINLLRLQGSHI
jgi:hypothetical protein